MTYSFDAAEHVHTLDGNPLMGTSTVVGVLNKPGLTYWAAGLSLSDLGWTNGKKRVNGKYVTLPLEPRLETAHAFLDKITGMSAEEYLKLLENAYTAHTRVLKQKASEGTDTHALLEDYVKECLVNGGKPFPTSDDTNKAVGLFARWACENVEKFVHSEANVYSERIYCGGITDLVMLMKNGKYAIGDHKSAKEAYESMFIQIAGYDLQQKENGFFDSNGKKIGDSIEVSEYYIFPYGSEEFEAAVRYNTSELQKMFECCVTLHKHLNV